jgi:hypothetical protein
MKRDEADIRKDLAYVEAWMQADVPLTPVQQKLLEVNRFLLIKELNEAQIAQVRDEM